MDQLPANVPRSAITEMYGAFVPENEPEDSIIEVSLRLADEDLELRDLGAFLELVDRIYGRLSENGLQSYARREYGHLQVQEIRRGSWELILREVIASGYSHALILAYLAVKFLPKTIESLATSYNQVEQGRLAKQQRKRIRTEMEQDEQLAKLPKERRNQLATLVEALHEKEKERIHRATRFANRRLKGVNIRIRKRDE